MSEATDRIGGATAGRPIATGYVDKRSRQEREPHP
jgi:hypothetical protein